MQQKRQTLYETLGQRELSKQKALTEGITRLHEELTNEVALHRSGARDYAERKREFDQAIVYVGLIMVVFFIVCTSVIAYVIQAK